MRPARHVNPIGGIIPLIFLFFIVMSGSFEAALAAGWGCFCR